MFSILLKINLVVNLYIVQKNKKAEEKVNINRGFQCLYATIILIDSIHRKDKNYYPKVFLEKYYFIEDIKFIAVILRKTIMMKNV